MNKQSVVIENENFIIIIVDKNNNSHSDREIAFRAIDLIKEYYYGE